MYWIWITVIVLVFIISLPILLKIYCKLTCGISKCSKHLVGKVVIVTGGNAGIGYATAIDMAERGARVILGCRNEARGTTAKDKIVSLTGNTDVHYQHLDLESLTSVRTFANNILATENRLDILINNAGVYEAENKTTEDGLLDIMAINHFGPFLLTSLLLPLLKRSAPSRIINVSSSSHLYGTINLQDLNVVKTTKFGINPLYCDSKLCNVLMTVELAQRLKNTGVTTNSLGPGLVETEIMNNVKFMKDLKKVRVLFAKSLWEGAQTTVYLAVSPEVNDVSGGYFSDCQPSKVNKLAQDFELARQLWEVSEKLVKLN